MMQLSDLTIIDWIFSLFGIAVSITVIALFCVGIIKLPSLFFWIINKVRGRESNE